MNDFDFGSQKTKFNWGAFFLTWAWGIFNKTYITLIVIPISMIPIIGIILNFACSIWFGINGNKWALENKEFKDLDEFVKYQKSFVVASIILYLLYLVVLIFGALDITMHLQLFYKLETLMLWCLLSSVFFASVFLFFAFYSSKPYKPFFIILAILTLVLVNTKPILEFSANIDFRTNKLDSAITKNKILSKLPFIDKEKYLKNVALCYVQKHEPDNAISYYEQAFKDTDDPEKRDLITYVYVLKGDYETVAKRGQDYVLFAKNGDWNKAVAAMENKLKDANPEEESIFAYWKTSDLYLNLAIAYKKLGKQDKAAENLNNAIKLNSREEQKYRKIFNESEDLYFDFSNVFAYKI